jgi:hypothetical protein
MSISQRLAAEKQQAEKPTAAASTAAAKGGKAEGEEEEDEAADDEPEPEEKKAKGKSKAKAKSKPAKKAESEEDDADAEGEDDEEEMAAGAADPGTVAQLCADAGVASMAKALIDGKLPLAKVKARINSAGTIRAAVATAGRVCRTIDPKLADSFIANGASVEHVKAQMFDMIIKAEGQEIRSSHAETPAGGSASSGNYGWDKAVQKVNERHAR